MTRMAWGSTIRRMALPRLMPSAWAASIWPLSTLRIPARAISAMYAASDADEIPVTPPAKPTKIALASKGPIRQSPLRPSHWMIFQSKGTREQCLAERAVQAGP